MSGEIERGSSPEEAVAAVLPRLHGAFALAILFRDHAGMIVGARQGAPLTVGYGEGENYLGSDAHALAGLTQAIADPERWAVVDGTQPEGDVAAAIWKIVQIRFPDIV